MKKAIVLGGQYGALGVIKALAMNGIKVILIAQDPYDHACHSRYISQRIIVQNPIVDAHGILSSLMEANEDYDGALLIPTLDDYVIFISKNKKVLEKKYVFAVQDWEVSQRIINKDLLYQHAQKTGIPIPRFILPRSIESINEQNSELFFPCILKPYESYKFRDIYKKKVLMVHDFQELINILKSTRQNGLDVMISEIIPGDDSSIYSYRSYIDSQGDFLAEMCTQKLRQYPAGFGQGSVVRTIPIVPEIRDQAQKLLKSLSYYGESSTEFRLDHRDNQYKLMEINIRPVVTEWLFIKAGINFPYLTYLDLVENKRIAPQSYKPELYWIHNYWEIANFFVALKSRTLNLREFMSPYRYEKVYAFPFLDDPINYLIDIFSISSRLIRNTLRV